MNYFRYTLGNELTLNQGNYIGYFNYTDGVFRSGKNANAPGSFILDTSTRINGEFLDHGFVTERIPEDVSTLPVSSIEVPANRVFNGELLNPIISKLYNNFLYIYGQASVVNNDIPTFYTSYATANGPSNMQWFSPTNTTSSDLSSYHPSLSSLVQVLTINTDRSGIQNIIIVSKTSMFVFESDVIAQTLTQMMSAVSINNVDFEDIVSCAIIKDNMFICDNGTKQIFKIDISTAKYHSRVNTNNPVYVDALTDNDSISLSFTYDNELYVLHPSNGELRVYDEYLNRKRVYKSTKIQYDDEIVSLSVNIIDNTIYILSKQGDVTIVDRDFSEVRTAILPAKLDDDEFYVSLKVSTNDSNVCYVASNKYVYKCILSRGFASVGRFLWNKIPVYNNEPIVGMDSIGNDIANSEGLYIYTKNYILLLFERTTIASILLNTDFVIYTEADIVFRNEYISYDSYNEMIKKFIFNHKSLYSNLVGRFAYEYDELNNLVLKEFRNRSVEFSLELYDIDTYDGYLATNELISPQTINRTLQKILDTQNKILSLMLPIITNVKNEDTTTRFF